MVFSSSVDIPDWPNKLVIPIRNECDDRKPFTFPKWGVKASLMKLFSFLAVRAAPEASLKAGWSVFSPVTALL